MAHQFRIIRTRDGYVGMVGSQRGLCRVYLPDETRWGMKAIVRSEFPDASESANILNGLADGLKRFFKGEQVDFDIRLDWSGWNSFEIDVWRACREIPYGETGSYKSLAERLGRPGAARAVGTAMGRNPFPIVVPCHRVVKSDGSLGGYSGRGGVSFKRRLLDMERAAPLEPV